MTAHPGFAGRLRRGTPCSVRRPGARWQAHVCSQDTALLERLAYCDSDHWLYRHDGWEVRVEPRFLEAHPTAPPATWRVGVTGTRRGLTAEQRAAVGEHLRVWSLFALDWPEFHHGGCVGADRDVHRLAREHFGRVGRVVIHPASDQGAALCDWTDADEVLEPAPSLERNRHIVEALSVGSVLLACPGSMREEQRSGTWATVRCAWRLNRGVILFFPDGSVSGERGANG